MNTSKKTAKTVSANQNCAKMIELPEGANTNSAPKGVRDKTYKYFGVSKAEYEAAQAQHSPLPWKESPALLSNTVSIVSTKGLRTEVVSNGLTAANARLIVASVNHAEALAEALRDCIASLDWAKAIITDIPEQSTYNENIAIAREALANWEGARQ